MTDFFLLLMISGAGDELQGIKRGIMEMADLIAINKADGDRVQAAEMTRVQYQNALRLFPPTASQWVPKSLACSSLAGTGIREIWDAVTAYVDQTRANGYFSERRKQQSAYWMYTYINEILKNRFYQHASVRDQFGYYERQVADNRLSPFAAADRLIDEYLHSMDKS